ncbi:MAG: hypothetical protein DRI86_13710, partial [Bacteroidetes bacterium]
MKTLSLITLVLICFTQYANSQITILSSDIGSVNDTARYSHAILAPIFTIETTGADYTWDFSSLTAGSQTLNEYKNLNSVPTIYKIAFWGKASFASPQANQSTAGLNLTDSYKFIKKTSSIFKITGIGGELNGTPLPIIFNSPDIIYNFPLNYNNTDSSNSKWSASLPNTGYIEEILNRKDTVDGWGIIKTPYGEFNCLRLKSEVHKEDTIYMASSGIGMRIPQNYTEYTWLSKNMKFPIMKATITHGLFEQASIVYMDSIRSFVSINATYCPAPALRIMPNPASDYVKIEINTNNYSHMQIIDIQGNIILDKLYNQQNTIHLNTSKWAKGI